MVLVAASAVLFILKQKKELMIEEGTHFLENLLSRETQLDVKIGKVSGRLSGAVRFQDVRLEDPALPAEHKLILSAKEIELNYRLLDFLTKNFTSKIVLKIEKPELYWHSEMSLKRDRFGFFSWLREWGLVERRHLRVIVKDLKLIQESGKEFSSIQLEYENDAFKLQWPLRHLEVWGHDVSTEINVRGQFEPGLLNSPDSLSGEIFTEGTVVNWSPLPWESSFRFTFTLDTLTLQSSNFLGGFDLSAALDLKNEKDNRISLSTKQYPFSNFAPFVRSDAKTLEGHMDLEAHLRGLLESPNLEAYVTLYGGRVGSQRYQTMNLHIEGVYPTVRLLDSRILLDEGRVMRLANQTLEFKDLFNEASYKKMVSASDQDTVVLGDWELRRPTDERQRPEFTMQRSFGKYAQMHIKKYNETDEEKLDSPETNDVEVGFEYRLKSKDSVKFEMREDERFVGVERKMSF